MGLFGKPFKETGLGKALWKIGDTFKGKTKVGQVLDPILEIAPIPNPIRYGKMIDEQKQLKKLADDSDIKAKALDKGVDLDAMLDKQPSWVKPALAGVVCVGVFVLVGMGVLDVGFLKWMITEIINAVVGG